MLGILFILGCSTVLGIGISELVGLRRLGREWQVGIGLAGVAISWGLVGTLGFPGLIRVAIDNWPFYPIWATVGTLLAAFLVGAVRPDPSV